MQRGHIVDHVERLRTKPEHIRMRIAMVTSFGLTGFVALVWGSTTLLSGTLALNPFNSPSTNTPTYAVTGTTNSPLVAGAADAVGGNNAPALEPVDVSTTTVSTSNQSQDMTGGNQTVVPF